VHIETFVIRRKYSGKIATEQQPPIRYQQGVEKEDYKYDNELQNRKIDLI